MNCPKCQANIPTKNINTNTTITQCEECKNVFKVSDDHSSSAATQPKAVNPMFDVESPPKGAWFEINKDQLILGSNTRSIFTYILVPFATIFSLVSIGVIYSSLTWELILPGYFFLCCSFFLWCCALVDSAGKVEITLGVQNGSIFTGLWFIGSTKHFTLDNLRVVRDLSIVDSENAAQYHNLLEGQDRVLLTSFFDDSKDSYVLQSLQQILADKANGKDFLQHCLSKHSIQ